MDSHFLREIRVKNRPLRETTNILRPSEANREGTAAMPGGVCPAHSSLVFFGLESPMIARAGTVSGRVDGRECLKIIGSPKEWINSEMRSGNGPEHLHSQASGTNHQGQQGPALYNWRVTP
jgi:hypothetical protein